MPGGDWKAKATVFGLVAVIGAALYPIVVVPLQIQYSGGRKKDPELQSGFQKKGMWGNIDAASKAQRGDQEGRAQR